MKTIIIILPVIFACLNLLAQETSRQQISAEQRFKQWDKNSDGKLTVEAVPGPQLFKQLDKNGDGVVTFDEAKAHYGGGRRRQVTNEQ